MIITECRHLAYSVEKLGYFINSIKFADLIQCKLLFLLERVPAGTSQNWCKWVFQQNRPVDVIHIYDKCTMQMSALWWGADVYQARNLAALMTKMQRWRIRTWLPRWFGSIHSIQTMSCYANQVDHVAGHKDRKRYQTDGWQAAMPAGRT